MLLLAVLWTAMSGHFEGLILALGAATIGLTVWLAHKMRLVDEEGMPLQTAKGIIPYGFWLLREVVQSNWAVGKIIVSKDAEIAPSVIEVRDGQRTDVGRALYANSISLTPGTVTLEADGTMMRVHALRDDIAGDVQDGDMERHVAKVDGGNG